MDYSKMISLIEQLCQDRGISKTTAYVQSGVGKDFGANIKKGNIPSAEKVKALADYLNCSTDYLLGRTAVPSAESTSMSNHEKELLAIMSTLNDEGIKQLLKQARYIASDDEYKKGGQSDVAKEA